MHFLDHRRGGLVFLSQGGLQQLLTLGGKLDVVPVSIALNRGHKVVEVQMGTVAKRVGDTIYKIGERLFVHCLAHAVKLGTGGLGEIHT